MSEVTGPYSESAHGVAAWPFGAEFHRDARPDMLPDGRQWPQVQVLIVTAGCEEALEATRESLLRQDYPEVICDVVSDIASAGSAWIAEPSGAAAEFLLLLRSGDLLAPGALPALCLEAALSGAEAVAGVRVLFDHGVHGLDLLRDPRLAQCEESGAPFTGGEILLSQNAYARAGGFDPCADDPMAELWRRLVSNRTTLARIGRPVLLQRDTGGASRPAADSSLSIACLTGLGYGGGAGIAHRRLAEALTLSGHRISHWNLGAESRPAAAEWTDRFPLVEQTIDEADHDLVLAGNLHGVTRSASILGRLAERVPVAAVLHDLFLLTGRCAHPKDCAVIGTGCDVRCPSPTEYPHLAPRRIAAAHAEKQDILGRRKAPLLLANSDWTAERARDLAPDNAKIGQIRLAFPTGVFRPQDRTAMRRRLGLPADDVLVMVSAVITDAPDKGFADLVATMAKVARPGIGFVAIGRLDDPSVFGLANLHAPGPIADEARLAEWYAACDIFLTASRLETLGQTPIEAGLCGTPTIAYRATGLTSAVLDGVTGLLVEPRPGALAEALETLIGDAPLRRRFGSFARIAFESRYSHAAAACSLHEAFANWDAMSHLGTSARIRFTPAMLGHFAFAKDRCLGANGNVGTASPAIVRSLRRAKQAMFGRGMPLWMRCAAYAVALARRGPSLLLQRK